MFIVTFLLLLCLRQTLVSAPWIGRNSSVQTCSGYENTLGINYRIVRFLNFFLYFILFWPCFSLQIPANSQLDALFHVFICFTSLHVSSITVLIIRRSNCINTSSGMISLCKWLLGMSVRRELQFPPDRHTKQSLTQTNHTRWCINTIRSPDYEHRDARNM